MTIAHVAERLAVESPLTVLKTFPTGNRTTISRMRGERSTTNPLTRFQILKYILYGL